MFKSKMFVFRLVVYSGLLMLWPVFNLHAQPVIDIEKKLSASDGAATDNFGFSISIDGNRALIGAWRDDDSTGSAYIFRFNGTDWEQTAKLTASDGATGDQFGNSVSIDGNRALIGACGDDDNGSASGSAYIFHFNGIDWEQETKLVASDGATGDQFGNSVSIDGNRALIGAWGDDDNGSASGSAYIFHFNGIDWEQETKLVASDGAPVDFFGSSVSIDGNRALIGAWNDEISLFINQGSAYIFRFNGIDWEQETKLTASDAAAGALFGHSVSIEGNRALIGAWGDDDNGSGSGSAYIFRFNGTDWEQEAKLTASDAAMGDGFGQSVSIDGNRALIGTYLDDGARGSAYIFRFNGAGWEQETKLTAIDAAAGAQFGSSVSIEGSTMLCGATGDDNSPGSAYLYELIARPGAVFASNGLYADRVNVKWTDRSETEGSFYIYRNGDYMDYTDANISQWVDDKPIPGRIHRYSVCARNDDWGESNKTYAEGWCWAEGKIEGYVRTRMVEGIPDATISVFPTAVEFTNILNFNGTNDFIYIPHDNAFNLNRWTLEAWIFPRGNGPVISKAPENLPTFEMNYESTSQSVSIGFSNDGGTPYQVFSTNQSVPLNQWTHIAGTFDSDTLRVIINGSPDNLTPAQDNPHYGDAPIWIGRSAGDYFNGKIDEVRLWSVARDSSDILSDMHRILRGDESGLTAYWACDDSSRAFTNVAADFANDGGHHGIIFGANWLHETPNIMYRDLTDNGGKYSVNNIYYDNEREFTIIPAKGNHGFDPQFDNGTLDYNSPLIFGINFIDTTAITVRGIIRYANTTCGVEGVKIILDDDTTAVRTLPNGSFSIQVDNPGSHTIKPFLGNSQSVHTFEPPQITRNIQENVSDLEFRDTQKYTLTVIAGGPCGSSIGDATLSIAAIGNNPGCFDTTLTTDANNPSEILLPAQRYRIDVMNLDNPNPDIFNYFEPDTVDLIWQNSTQIFTYRTKPVVYISGFLDYGHGDYEGVPIVDQHFPYDIKIEVFDKYGNDSCHVEEGSVTIYDNLGRGSAKPVTLTLENGVALYRLMPDQPQTIFPYQKLFQVNTHVGQETQKDTLWILIQGEKTRGETYASVSPQLPLLILRDPPGDGSYAYIKKDSSISCSFSNYYQRWDESGEFTDIKKGAVMEIGVSLGEWVAYSFASEFGGYQMDMEEYVKGTENLASNELITTLTMTETFQTSDLGKVIGPKGDIFVGASFNMLYGLADIVDYNPATYEVVLDSSISWFPEGFNTTYIYTEYHIKNYEIPKLIEARNRSEDPAQRAKLGAAILTWKNLLTENEQLKKRAVHKQNITFAGDESYAYESTVTVDTSFSIEYMQYFDKSTLDGIGLVLASTPHEWGTTARMGWRRGTVKGTNITNTTTIGYQFEDDDTGDDFTVDIKEDKAFGTPVFELVAGQSSCPWEPGTMARDGVDLSINSYLMEDVPLDQPAVFELYCGNTSETGEERIYEIKLIAGSNPDGAAITIGGNPTTDPIELVVPSNQALKQTLRVERRPPAFDFNNLQVMMYPPCQYELFQQNLPIVIADTVTFSVHFDNSGSPVFLHLPETNWVLDQTDTHLDYLISDYDLGVADSIMLQYKREGGSWWTAISYATGSLTDSIKATWDITDTTRYPDGPYQLRAAAASVEGINFSNSSSGIIDRNSLIVVSAEPDDDVLHSGDEICVHFSDAVDEASAIAAENVALIAVEETDTLDISVSCSENTLTIQTEKDLAEYAGKYLTATVYGISSINGPVQRKTASWTFKVNEDYTLIAFDQTTLVPDKFYLRQNYPNPFNPSTTIEYGLPAAEHVRIILYNMLGQKIRVLVDRVQQPGNYSAIFSIDDGRLASGVYYYMMQAGAYQDVKKMVLIK